MRHRRKPPSDQPRDGTMIPDDEWREILDRFLLGESFATIAGSLSREESAIQHIIEGKIPLNYTENGKRESPVEKLRGVPSLLDLDRPLTGIDREYLTLLIRHRRTPEESAIILHVAFGTLMAELEWRVGRLRPTLGESIGLEVRSIERLYPPARKPLIKRRR